MSVCARYYIRIVVQKEFGLDDAFLALATAFLISVMAILYTNMNNMYFIEAMIFALARFKVPSQGLDWAHEFLKLNTTSLTLSWMTLMAVKFSFLALFRRLIDRIPPLIIYWWVVVTFNLAITGYGASLYYLLCPNPTGLEVGKI